MRDNHTKPVRKAAGRSAGSVRNRRATRTREALLGAFGELVLARGYDRLTVRDIVLRARVSRSTFYEHFENRDDLLGQSMDVVLLALADSVTGRETLGRLERTIEHLWQHRRLARKLLSGTTRIVVASYLSKLVAQRLQRSSRFRPLIATPLAAAHIASAQLGLLDAWLAGEGAATPKAVATAISACAASVARTLRVN